jgi:acyl-coenzyme A synthetase/AMP-(fatty) acid ligase
VARGYLHRPDLTAERFIAHPFSNVPGARLYRTGDLVSLQPDGQLTFLGRLDDQLKLQGHRIEPAEIEVALNHHPAVQASVVVARATPTADKRLTAYIVPAPGVLLTRHSLQAHLASQLPEYMVPATVVCIASVPLTAIG